MKSCTKSCSKPCKKHKKHHEKEHEHKKEKPKGKMAKKKKVEKVMHEFGAHELHSGSKKGPVVTNPRQAVAIALSESGQSKKKSKRK
jgi:hypothetical protein